MELRQLRYFVAIVDQGSLTRAVNILHIAQPALSHQLAQLESELGAKLLLRSAQGTTPTEAGRIFYQHALSILKQVDAAKAAVGHSNLEITGSVTLGMPPGIAGMLALPILAALQRSYPVIRLQLSEEMALTLSDQLKTGRVDLAILFDDGCMSPFIVTPLIEERIMFIASPSWLPSAVKAGQISLAEAVQTHLILPTHQQGIRPFIDRLISGSKLIMNHVTSINSFTITRLMLLENIGATIQHTAPFSAELKMGSLVALPISDTIPYRTVSLCSSRNIPLTNAAIAVQSIVRDTVNDLCGSGQWLEARGLPS